MIVTTYKILIPATPYPFEGKATAVTLKQATNKVAYQARRCGLSASAKALEYEVLSRKEV